MFTLYTTPTFDHFYRLPEGVALPAGGELIRTLGGEEHRADVAALAPFEITLAQAQQALLEQMDPLLEALGRLVEQYQALSALEARAEGKMPTTEVPTDDVESAKEQLSPLVAALGSFLRQSTSDAPEEQAAAQETIRDLRAGLTRAGIPVSEEMERIPDRLREDDLETVRQENQVRIAEAFKELTDELAAAATTLGRELDEKLAELEADRGARVDLKTAFNRRGDVDG
jgi:hypothetical protein